MAKKSGTPLVVLAIAIAASAALLYLRRSSDDTVDAPAPELAMLEPGDAPLQVLPRPEEDSLPDEAARALPPLEEMSADEEPRQIGMIGEREATNPYTGEAMNAAFLAMLPPPPDDIEPFSAEHYEWARAEGAKKYAKQAVKGEPAPARTTSKSSSTPNPYNAMSEQGGVLSMIPPDVGLDAKNEAELLQAYRQRKSNSYSAKATR